MSDAWARLANEPPRAEVQRVGRWTYYVTINHGILETYVGHVLGRRRAYRKAARAYTRYLRRCEYRAEIVTSELDENEPGA